MGSSSAVDQVALGPSERSPYSQVGVLGRGASSVVYLASPPKGGADVALKCLAEGTSAAQRRQFWREVQVLRRLRHPSVVRILDSGPGAEPTWFAMERLRGATLQEALRGQRRPPWSWVRGFLCGLLRAVQAVHERGFAHGDIKPSNCYLREHGDFDAKPRVVLLDFGAARPLDEPLAPDDDVAGTPPYLAPERVIGGPPSVAADVYSVAALGYELLTGAPFSDVPRSGPRVSPELARHTDALQAVPRAALAALMSGLDEQPARRPASASAFAQALDGAPFWSLARVLRGDDAMALLPELSLLAERVQSMWVDGSLAESRAGFVDVRQGHRVLVDDEARVSHADLADTFESSGRSMLLLGAPGFGKSVAALKVCRRLLDLRRRSNAPGAVPVVLPLHAWRAASRRWDEWLELELRVRYWVPRSAARKMLRGRRLVLILDGLDEVPQHALQGCAAEIDRWLELDVFDGVLVTCRTAQFRDSALELAVRATIELLPLESEDVRAQLLGTQPELAAHLDRGRGLAELTRTPLMLRLLQSLSGRAPLELARGAELSGERLIDEYIALHLRELPAGPELRGRVAALSRLALRDGQRVLRSEGLQPSLLDSAWAGTAYALVGRFVTAGLACFAPILAVIYSPLENAGFAISTSFAVELSLKGTVVAGGCYAALALLGLWSSRLAQGLPALRFVARAADSLFARGVAAALVIGGTALWVGLGNPPPVYAMGVEAGLLGVAALGWARSRASILDRDITLSRELHFAAPSLRAVAAVVAGALAVGLVAGTDSSIAGLYTGASFGAAGVALVALRNRPRAGFGGWNTALLRCLRGALMAAVVAMVATTLAFGNSFGLTYGACVALTFAGGAFLWLGGAEVIHYLVLVALLRLEGQLPRRARQALDAAVGVRLMKRVGSGYTFIHDAVAQRVAAVAARLDE